MSNKKRVAVKTEDGFYEQVRDVFVEARQFVHKTANFAMVKAYWLVGKMIVEKQGGEAKAAYGDKLIVTLSSRLTEELASGFTISNLKYMRKFYQSFPISHTLCDQLSWSHYRLLISVENEEARAYYLEEARKFLWSVRELQRQINSFYYERLLDEKHCVSINPPNLQDSGKPHYVCSQKRKQYLEVTFVAWSFRVSEARSMNVIVPPSKSPNLLISQKRKQYLVVTFVA